MTPGMSFLGWAINRKIDTAAFTGREEPLLNHCFSLSGVWFVAGQVRCRPRTPGRGRRRHRVAGGVGGAGPGDGGHGRGEVAGQGLLGLRSAGASHVLPCSSVTRKLANMIPELVNRITVEPGKRSGKPCIRGSRITVSDVLEYLASGMTEAEILADFPELTVDDIRACLAFAAERERRLLGSVA